MRQVTTDISSTKYIRARSHSFEELPNDMREISAVAKCTHRNENEAVLGFATIAVAAFLLQSWLCYDLSPGWKFSCSASL